MYHNIIIMGMTYQREQLGEAELIKTESYSAETRGVERSVINNNSKSIILNIIPISPAFHSPQIRSAKHHTTVIAVHIYMHHSGVQYS